MATVSPAYPDASEDVADAEESPDSDPSADPDKADDRTEAGEPDDADEAEEQEPSDEPDEAEDPYAIPDEIDAAYLDRVFEALNEVALEARLEILEHEEYTDRADELLSSIYTENALDLERADWASVLDEGSAGLEQFADGPLRTDSMRVVDRSGACVAALTRQDRDAMLVDAPPPSTAYSLLLSEGEPSAANPTPWMLATRVKQRAVDTEEDLCERFLEYLSDQES